LPFEIAQKNVELVDQYRFYANATRGNIEVDIHVV
jgi:organic hydroperoxide reductase OsmC/OhrA